MKAKILAASLLMSMSLASTGAYAKPSCLKGAAAGAVGGHFLGRHHVLGAAVGCAVGHHMSKKQEREQAQAQANANAQAQANANARTQPTTTRR
jgi:hypothetical protein